MSPNVYIVAGPNGAGKTTFAREFLPSYADCKNFVNADLIAQGVSPFAPESVAFRAGRLMIEEIQLLAERQLDFGFETTLSGRAHLHLVRDLKNQGYKVHIYFLWVPDVELSASRVRNRVMEGGHDVPPDIQHRRFSRSIENFLRYYRRVADSWFLFENSGTVPEMIAKEESGKLDIILRESYDQLMRLYGGEDEQRT